MRECWVADRTSNIKLTLWEDQITKLHVGKCYMIQNVSTRMKDTAITLTCTRTTVFINHANFSLPEEMEQTEDHEPQLCVAKNTITAVRLKDKRVCKLCGGQQTTIDCKTKNHRCETCKLLQHTSKYVPNISGTIILDTQDNTPLTLTMPMSVLKTYLEQTFQMHLMSDVQDIEEHFLDEHVFEVHYNSEQILTSIHHIPTPKEDDDVSQVKEKTDNFANRDMDDMDNLDLDKVFQ